MKVEVLSNIVTAGRRHVPDKIAFKCGVKEESYSSLDQKSNLLAVQLNKLDIKKGDRVGIFMHRTIESAIAVYGILKAGAAFVPIDPSAPQSRINFILEDCNIQILISSPLQKKALQAISNEPTPLKTIIGLHIPEIASWNTILWEEIFSQKDSSSEIEINEDDLAYIMFTSGSTGVPKGIMHTHKSGLNYARLSAELYELSQDDVVGNVAPLFFDQSTFGYFSTPLSMATTILFQDSQLAMLGSFSNAIEKEKLTILYSVPLIFIQLLESNLIKDFNSLKWILYGGEPFPPNKLNKIIGLLPHVRISNIYGPAEVNQCTYKNISTPVDEDKSIPLGTVWSETSIKIVDDNDQEVETGTKGELLVHSSTMMKGYWNNHSLNQKAFYIDSSEPDRKFYRTGDMVKYNGNNELVFVGRKDRQTKVRGYRIELEEIEISLCSLEEVKDAAVYTVQEDNEKALHAAVTLVNSNGSYNPDLLKINLQKLVPKYAIPTYFRRLDSLPRTINGKIDYKELEKSHAD